MRVNLKKGLQHSKQENHMRVNLRFPSLPIDEVNRLEFRECVLEISSSVENIHTIPGIVG